VADELLAQGARTTVIIRDQRLRSAWARRGAHVAVGLLDDLAFLTRALSGAAGNPRRPGISSNIRMTG
jgi:uncharacterized protein YbjT (DUF2867 family)